MPYPDMLAEIVEGTLRPERLITRRMSLEEAPAALATMGDQPGHGIAMVIP